MSENIDGAQQKTGGVVIGVFLSHMMLNGW